MHANLIEKFLAKWLSAQVLDANADFAESMARQLKTHASQDSARRFALFGGLD